MLDWFESEIERLKAENAELRADRDRLDWLDKERGVGPPVRAAIDAARATAKQDSDA